ncbi:hypothetical protein [Burkholderia plantarii]|uniref:hypothetical protein n=1 Tax=Burkholderia plantarii TaxID=41899 RepID=UPI001F5BBDD8|nr:hypothetical protein [Burkholderia plantarii]
MVVPAGAWYCAGPIVLQSNVNFHLSATARSSSARTRPTTPRRPGQLRRERQPLLQPWQANDCLNFGAPVYARNASNIALTGEGPTSTLNGQAMTPFAGSGNTATCW